MWRRAVGKGWKGKGWMDEQCFMLLFCTVKAELGRGQPGLLNEMNLG